MNTKILVLCITLLDFKDRYLRSAIHILNLIIHCFRASTIFVLCEATIAFQVELVEAIGDRRL